MATTRRLYGLARSAAIYYGNPLRRRRLDRFYREFVQPSSLCFDVGAHVGNRVACWRRLGATVIAIEPQQDCVRVLKCLYGRDRGVTILATALGADDGESKLYIDQANPTISTLSKSWADSLARSDRFSRVNYSCRQVVPITTLDSLIHRFGHPDFVKIDVEGFEAQVLRGLHCPISALSFEILPEALDAALTCIDLLRALGTYEFNYSSGESHTMAYQRWLSAEQLRIFIEKVPQRANSGDIYARLL